MRASIQPGAVTYRRVAMQMGAWKWGYPRGKRHNVTKYEARPDKTGALRWYAVDTSLAGSGITARSESAVRSSYPAAYYFKPGSIHRQLARPNDVIHRAGGAARPAAREKKTGLTSNHALIE